MTFQGRSMDDLPLTAYSTGVAPHDEDPDLVPDAGYTSVPAPSSSTADLVAHAHADAAAAAPAASAKSGRRRFSLRLRMPSFGRGRQAALEAAAPFHAAAPSVDAPASTFHAVTAATDVAPRAFEAVHAPLSAPPFTPVHKPGPVADAGATTPRRRALPQLQLRDPRVLAGGAIVVGLVLLAISLLGGGQAPGTGGPSSSQGPGVGVLPSAAPVGNAAVELTSGLGATFSLTGATGAGPAVDSQLNATWTDPLGNSLGITGLASQGTRTTDLNFMLTWTMRIDGAVETFTSKASECTIGMAVGPKAVHGTFVCKKLTSDNGKYVVDFRGTYTT